MSPTSPTTSRSIASLLVALALGALGEYLFHPGLLGINAFIWTAALCGGALLVAGLNGLTFRGEGRWLIAPALMFAAFVAWRSSPVLQSLNVAAVIAILALASFRLREGKVRLGGVTEYLFFGILAAGMTIIGALELLFRRIEWRSLTRSSAGRQYAPFARALLVALPLVVLFASLLASADEVFSNALTGAVAFDMGMVASHAFRAVFWAWIAAGFFHGVLFDSSGPVPRVAPPAAIRLGPVEVTTVLGLLDVLFLAFVAIQVRYLFGVDAHVEITEGLTYAEYARRGFFELLAVAALVLPVVLGIHWLLRDSSPGLRIAFRVLATTMILLIFAVIASALRRMDAYVDEFGMSQLRLYSTAAMLWLVVVFAWLAATVLREQRQRFASGAIASGLMGIAALNVLNPDAFILEMNLDRADQREFDAAYALSLSPDATPTAVSGLSRLEPEERCELAQGLAEREVDSGGWQAWNYGRMQANESLVDSQSEREASCAP